MPDGEGLKPRFCCRRLDVGEAICKRGCSTFYFLKNTFDDVPISMWNHLKSVVILIKDIHQVIGIIDEEFDVINSISSMELDEEPSVVRFVVVGNSLNCKISFVSGPTAPYSQ